MSIPLSTLKARLRTWVINSTGLNTANVIFANQNAPKPTGTYITIDPAMNIKPVGGMDFEEWVNGEVVTRPVRRVLVSLQAYNTGAIALLTECLESLNRTIIYETFYNDGISVVSRESHQVKNITTISDGQFVERASFDFEVDIVGSNTDSPGYAETFEMEVDFYQPIPESNPINPVDINIEIPEISDTFYPVDPPFGIIIESSFTSAIITYEVS